ncbi:unnamed protein product [Darwinula stevensoni]|uniref:Uncharacterized protein n=1 Tax=Darwinula stevensoni TaxID=69355 RepID=A0A7R9ABE3_9CRUS|nr:unnamed protein product [Darwinula stevensoni]CAG0899297.1 unnamed protein product [Darwinula stevensoni]
MLLARAGISGSQEPCGGDITESAGIIYSPGYPDGYPANVTCAWTFRSGWRKIHLFIEEFNVEWSIIDCYGAMEFVSLSHPTGSTTRFCGEIPPGPIGHLLDGIGLMQFVSNDKNNERHRFKILYMMESRCPSGYFGRDGTNSCYFFSDEKLSFAEAAEQCTLASIHSREEQEFVQSHARSTFWIGARTTAPLGESIWNFEFMDGSPTDYQEFWEEGDVEMLTCGAGCGILVVADRWKNRKCEREEKPFVCESSDTPSAGPFQCFEYVNGRRCFFLPQEQGDWIRRDFDGAREHCRTYPDGDLIAIGGNEQKQVDLAKTFETVFDEFSVEYDEVWIGLRKADGVWKWVDGSLLELDRWEEEYPTEDFGKDCGVMTVSSWKDSNPQNQHYYVCKTTFPV